jgi:hypothetical protein
MYSQMEVITQTVEDIQTMVNSIPRSEDEFDLEKSPSFKAFRARFKDGLIAVHTSTEKLEAADKELVKDLDQWIKPWDSIAKPLDQLGLSQETQDSLNAQLISIENSVSNAARVMSEPQPACSAHMNIRSARTVKQLRIGVLNSIACYSWFTQPEVRDNWNTLVFGPSRIGALLQRFIEIGDVGRKEHLP